MDLEWDVTSSVTENHFTIVFLWRENIKILFFQKKEKKEKTKDQFKNEEFPVFPNLP